MLISKAAWSLLELWFFVRVGREVWMTADYLFFEMLMPRITAAFPSRGCSGGLWNWNTYPERHVYCVGWGLDVRWTQTGWGPNRLA